MAANYQFGCLMQGSELIRKGPYDYVLEESRRADQQYIGFWNEFDMNYWLEHRGPLNSVKNKIYVITMGKDKGVYSKCPSGLGGLFNPAAQESEGNERFRQMSAAKAWYAEQTHQQEAVDVEEPVLPDEQVNNVKKPEDVSEEKKKPEVDFYMKNLRRDIPLPSIQYPDKIIHIYVDASFSQTTSVGGYGIVFYQAEDYNRTFRAYSYALPVPSEIGIDSLEKLAILQALVLMPFPSSIIVHTDQKAVVEYVENGDLSELVAKGLFNEDFKEISLSQRSFWRKIARWKLMHDQLLFVYTPSHKGDEIHEVCDVLARQACRHYQEEESWEEGNLPKSYAAGYDYRKHYNKLSESSMLAQRAKLEEMETGKVSVVCPECHQHPTVFREGNRIVVACPCRYIFDGEIIL